MLKTLFMSLHVKGKKVQGRRPIKKEAVNREEGRDDTIQSLMRQEETGSTAHVETQVLHRQFSQ